MHPSRLSAFLLMLLLVTTTPALAQTDVREGLWEVTVQVDMGGQPATAQPLVMRQCINQQTAQDLMAKLTGGGGACNVSDFQETGGRATWNMACTGQLNVTGTGEVTTRGDAFDGTLNLTVAMGDQQIPMSQKFSARRVGDCK